MTSARAAVFVKVGMLDQNDIDWLIVSAELEAEHARKLATAGYGCASCGHPEQEHEADNHRQCFKDDCLCETYLTLSTPAVTAMTI